MLFQEFASEHNVNWKQIDVPSHAIKRSKERFGWEKHKDEQIKGNLRAILKNSTYIGEVIDEQGKLSHMFASDRKAIYLSGDLNYIATVMVHAHVSYAPLKNVLLNLHKRELRKINRTVNAKVKRLEDFKYDCNVNLAILQRRKKRTKSESVRTACQANINSINQTIREYEEEIKSIQDEKRLITRSMVAIL